MENPWDARCVTCNHQMREHVLDGEGVVGFGCQHPRPGCRHSGCDCAEYQPQKWAQYPLPLGQSE